MRAATKALIATLAFSALCGCGQKADLEPLANSSTPPMSYGAETQPTAEEMLKLETLAAPERSVELRRRSEPREDDPFDLPPE